MFTAAMSRWARDEDQYKILMSLAGVMGPGWCHEEGTARRRE